MSLGGGILFHEGLARTNVGLIFGDPQPVGSTALTRVIDIFYHIFTGRPSAHTHHPMVFAGSINRCGGTRRKCSLPQIMWLSSSRTFGATPSATKWYWYIARAHMQIAVQALEAFSICSGVKSGLLLKGSTYLMSSSSGPVKAGQGWGSTQRGRHGMLMTRSGARR